MAKKPELPRERFFTKDPHRDRRAELEIFAQNYMSSKGMVIHDMDSPLCVKTTFGRAHLTFSAQNEQDSYFHLSCKLDYVYRKGELEHITCHGNSVRGSAFLHDFFALLQKQGIQQLEVVAALNDGALYWTGLATPTNFKDLVRELKWRFSLLAPYLDEVLVTNINALIEQQDFYALSRLSLHEELSTIPLSDFTFGEDTLYERALKSQLRPDNFYRSDCEILKEVFKQAIDREKIHLSYFLFSNYEWVGVINLEETLLYERLRQRIEPADKDIEPPKLNNDT